LLAETVVVGGDSLLCRGSLAPRRRAQREAVVDPPA